MESITGKFELVVNPPYLCQVSADSRGLTFRNVEDRQGGFFEKRINIADIIGCHCMQEKGHLVDGNPKTAVYFCIYAYPLQKKAFSLKTFRRVRETVTFKVDIGPTFADNLKVAKNWKLFIVAAVRLIHNIMADVTDSSMPVENISIKPRKLLILVNPNSGPKRARKIFDRRVKPVLAEAGVNYDLTITERANHARDMVKTYDLYQWDGIVIVSGDGLIFEVINGIMERSDWREVLRLPIGVVPGGSGNGLARAISYSIREPYDSSNQMYNSMTASMNFIRGRVSHMDLIKVMTINETIYSFLSIGWGLFADIDIESEKMRSWGEARFIMRAFVRIAGLRLYKGKLSYLPIEGYVPPLSASPMTKSRNNTLTRSKTVNDYSDEVPDKPSVCVRSRSMSGKADIDEANSSNPVNGSKTEDKLERTDVDGATADDAVSSEQTLTSTTKTEEVTIDKVDELTCDDKLNSKSSNNSFNERINDENCLNSKSCSHDDKKTSVHIPPLNEPVPDNWIIEEDEYVMVYVSSVTHVGSNICLAPDARFDDGIMWMVIIRGDVTRAQILEFCMCLEDGRHVNSTSCCVIPVRAFRLEPSMEPKDHLGYMTVDGEVIDYGPIQAGVLPSVARVMTK